MLDCCLLRHESARQFLQPERHGQARVLHDPQDLLEPAPFDRVNWNARIAARMTQMAAAFPIYRLLVEKELERGRLLDAIAFYQSLLRLFVELAGIVHRPERYDYGLRYLHADMPQHLQSDRRSAGSVREPCPMVLGTCATSADWMSAAHRFRSAAR